jgi:hypothetical protein
LRNELANAKAAIQAATVDASAAMEQKLAKARADVAQAQEDLATFQKMLAESQEAFAADMEGTKAAHQREIESLSVKHVEATQTLKSAHEGEVAKLNTERADLRSQLEDEREAKEKALSQVEISKLVANAPPPPSPRTSNTGIYKEELEKLHQAHNATLMEVEAAHNKALGALKQEIADKQAALDSARAETSRKEMEIGYMAADKEETDNELERFVIP